jgi:hypothetical protein
MCGAGQAPQVVGGQLTDRDHQDREFFQRLPRAPSPVTTGHHPGGMRRGGQGRHSHSGFFGGNKTDFWAGNIDQVRAWNPARPPRMWSRCTSLCN